MSEFESDNSNNDEKDRNQADNVIGISKKENPTNNCSCCSNSCPHCISRSNGDDLHRLRNGKETQYDKDDSDDAWDQTCKTL